MEKNRPGTAPLTGVLAAARAGDEQARRELFEYVYSDLRRLARVRLSARARQPTLNTTALVHEVFVKLTRQAEVPWKDRAHFLASAGTAMRSILVDYARRKRARKRSAEPVTIELDRLALSSGRASEEILALDEALSRLETLDRRKSRVVEYQFFGGLTIREMAEVLGVSPATIKRDWNFARAWLFRELQANGGPEMPDQD